MGSPASPNHHGRRLALGLRRLREAADLLQKDVAEEAHLTLQKVSRIESGQVPGYHELKALLAIYGVPAAEWPPYLDLWSEARKRPWWRKYRIPDNAYILREDVAAAKYEFQLGCLPALLQTEEYARAVITRSATVGGRSVDNEVAVLLRQQERLFSDQPLRLHALIHIPALRRGVDRSQLAHLLRCAKLPNIALQVVPQRDDVYDGLHSSLIVLSFDHQQEPDIAFSDSPVGLIHTQDPERVRAVRKTLDRLAAFAMTTEASIELITEMMG